MLHSEHPLFDLQETKDMPLMTKKLNRRASLLLLCAKLNVIIQILLFFSGYALNIEGQKDLNGIPDFLISAKSGLIEPQRPIFCIFESKNKVSEEDFAPMCRRNVCRSFV